MKALSSASPNFKDANSEVVNRIIEAEGKEGLFDLNVNGIRVYQHMRMGLYYEIMKKLGYFSPQYTPRFRDLVKNLPYYIWNILHCNDLWGIHEHKVLVLENPRKILLDGYYRDINTDIFVKKLSQNICIVKWPYQSQYYKPELSIAKKKIYYDYFAWKRRVEIKLRWNDISDSQCSSVAKKIELAFKKNIASEIEIRSMVKAAILNIYQSVSVATRFIKKVKPSLIITVIAYGKSEFVHAAKELGLPVVEIQHGIISPYNLGYHYPNVEKNSLEAFPNYLLTFGDYWNSAASFPIPSRNIIATGYPFFQIQKDKYSNIKKNVRQILFISQKTIGKELAKFAVEVARMLPDYRIVFKLHPKQYRSWRSELSILAANAPSNIHVVGVDGPSIYKLFAESEWQVGCFSTAIYEGLGWGLKTILCAFSGWKYMEKLIDRGEAKLVFKSEDVVKLIMKMDRIDINTSDYFKPNAIENIIKALTNITLESKKRYLLHGNT